jgi:galactose mutarotase-like enzyme
MSLHGVVLIKLKYSDNFTLYPLPFTFTFTYTVNAQHVEVAFSFHFVLLNMRAAELISACIL